MWVQRGGSAIRSSWGSSKTLVWFPTSIMGTSQPPLTSASGDVKPSFWLLKASVYIIRTCCGSVSLYIQQSRHWIWKDCEFKANQSCIVSSDKQTVVANLCYIVNWDKQVDVVLTCSFPQWKGKVSNQHSLFSSYLTNKNNWSLRKNIIT